MNEQERVLAYPHRRACNAMGRRLQRLLGDDRGVSSIEYAVLAVGIALVVLTGAQYLGGNINSAFTKIASKLVADV